MKRSHRFLAVAGIAMLTLAACSSASPSASASGEPSGSAPPAASVRLQLQWFPQA
jgi:hypothetical protein